MMGRVNFPAHTASLVVKAAFHMVHGGVCQPLEPQPALEGDVLSKAKVPECLYDADLALFKPRADLLLTGTCHVPGGKASTTCPVSFRVGGWSKSLACIGNRVWHKGMVFAKVGEIEPFTKLPLTWANAFGGPKHGANPAGKGAKDGILPNIELPTSLITGYGDKPQPAGFGPVHRTWKLRTGKLGTYDNKWLKERFPAFPKDFDWTYFNAAPADQQLEGFLRGDEEVELTNLHADHAVLKTRLPGLRVRVLLREGNESEPARVREVPMNLDTLHVDADKSQMYLVWRGIADVSDSDWLECRDVLVVSEPVGKAQPLEALVPLFDTLQEGDEAPEEVETKAHRAERAKQLEAEISGIEKLVDGYAAKAESQAQASIGSELNIAKAATKPASPGDLKSMIDKLLASPLAAEMGLPKRISAADLDILADPDVKAAMKLAQSGKAPKPTDTKGLMGLLKSREAQGGDFSGSELESQDLAGADLTDCYFNDAQLSGANLAGAKLKGVSFIGAKLAGADLTGADLTDADFSGADLSGAKLDNAKLDDVMMIDAVAEGASFAGAQGKDAICAGLKAANAVFTGAKLEAGVFTGAQLQGADFTGASLKDSGFDQVDASGAKFEKADLSGFRGGEKSNFTNAKCKGANGAGSVWENSTLKGADFSECNLKDAQFQFSDLSGARFFGADLSGAMLRKANLSSAQAGNANFHQALLEQADLRGASLVASNFYAAEFLDAKTKGADFGGANLKMTKLEK